MSKRFIYYGNPTAFDQYSMNIGNSPDSIDATTGAGDYSFFATGTWSLSFWTKTTDVVAAQNIAIYETVSFIYTPFILSIDPVSGILNMYAQGSAGLQLFNSDNFFPGSDWYNIVLTHNGDYSDISQYKLYVNGNLEPFTALANDDNTGGYSDFSADPAYVLMGQNCYMDEVFITNTEINAAGVTAIYNAGVPKNEVAQPGLQTYWRMGEGATWDGTDWIIPDLSPNTITAVTSNMPEASRVTDVPS